MGQWLIKICVLLSLILFFSGCSRQKAEDLDAKLGEYLSVIEKSLQTTATSSSSEILEKISENKENKDQVVEDKAEKGSGKQTFSLEQRKKINAWLEEKNLNRYGDPRNTVYASGTPLFDLSTGKARDRYQYILEHHQDLLDYLSQLK